MRVATWFKDKRGLFRSVYVIAFLFHLHCRNKYGVELPIGLKVGSHFAIAHLAGVVINGNAVLGNHVLVMQNVTIGSARGKGVPFIGNNVLLCAGCKVIGGVRIGDNVVVGANAVVVKDIPNGCVVAGVPAKIVNRNSKETLKYYI